MPTSSSPPSVRRPVLCPDAFAATPLALVIEQIVASVRVALWAMRLPHVRAREGVRRADRVLLRRAWVEMRRVHASSVHAEMVECRTSRDWPSEELVAEPVSERLFPLTGDLHSEVAIAVRSDGAAPLPTSVGAGAIRRQLGLKSSTRVLSSGAAVPPYHSTEYSEHIGHYLMTAVQMEAAA